MKTLKTYIFRLRLKLKTFDIQKSIVIFSEARGGSTWVMELLKHIPGVVVNWEPLHVDNGVVPKSYRLGWRPKIPEYNQEKKYRSLFSDIIRMRTFNDWTAKFVSWRDLNASRHVLTKFVRANQCLPWFVNTFENLDHPPIFLLRHPISTCISRLKTFQGVTGENVRSLPNDLNFRVPDCIHNERFANHEKYINTLRTQLEVEIAIWCINNANIITHKDRHKWHVVYYEDLVLNPQDTFKAILSGISIEMPIALLDQIQYTKPSASNFLGTYKASKTKQLESYLNDLKQDDLKSIQAVFDHFQLKVYSAFSAYPIK